MTGDRLAGEGLVQLDEVEIVDVEPGALERLARGRDGAEAHDRRVDAGDGRRDDAGQRREAVLARASPASTRTVALAPSLMPGAVAGRDRAALAERGPQPRQRLQRRVGARMLVARRSSTGSPLGCGTITGTIWFCEAARRRSPRRRAAGDREREGVLVLAR